MALYQCTHDPRILRQTLHRGNHFDSNLRLDR